MRTSYAGTTSRDQRVATPPALRDHAAVLYMVIERYKNQDPVPIYRRARDYGRLLPEGLHYVSSWVEPEYASCFQLMATDDPELFKVRIARWSDLVEFEVVPVITSQEAADRVAPSL